MNVSTISGFLIGVVAAASLTVIYGDKLHHTLSEAARLSLDSLAAMEVLSPGPGMPTDPTPQALAPGPVAAQAGASTDTGDAANSPATADTADTTDTTDTTISGMEQRWAEFAARAESLQPTGDFPWRSCFSRAAASYDVPESLLLAIAKGESNFDPAARSDKDAVGLMQIRWPHTSRHLGVVREADLYDPCTNVDAGARYLRELAGRFNNNLHLAVAAYNYGPGAIGPERVPEGAQWYSQYIYRHLQQVLGDKRMETPAASPGAATPAAGQLLVMSFSAPQRARDFVAFLQRQVPGLNIQVQSNALGQHDVVLLYGGDAERQTALDAIGDAGVAPLALARTNGNKL